MSGETSPSLTSSSGSPSGVGGSAHFSVPAGSSPTVPSTGGLELYTHVPGSSYSFSIEGEAAKQAKAQLQERCLHFIELIKQRTYFVRLRDRSIVSVDKIGFNLKAAAIEVDFTYRKIICTGENTSVEIDLKDLLYEGPESPAIQAGTPTPALADNNKDYQKHIQERFADMVGLLATMNIKIPAVPFPRAPGLTYVGRTMQVDKDRAPILHSVIDTCKKDPKKALNPLPLLLKTYLERGGTAEGLEDIVNKITATKAYQTKWLEIVQNRITACGEDPFQAKLKEDLKRLEKDLQEMDWLAIMTLIIGYELGNQKAAAGGALDQDDIKAFQGVLRKIAIDNIPEKTLWSRFRDLWSETTYEQQVTQEAQATQSYVEQIGRLLTAPRSGNSLEAAFAHSAVASFFIRHNPLTVFFASMRIEEGKEWTTLIRDAMIGYYAPLTKAESGDITSASDSYRLLQYVQATGIANRPEFN